MIRAVGAQYPSGRPTSPASLSTYAKLDAVFGLSPRPKTLIVLMLERREPSSGVAKRPESTGADEFLSDPLAKKFHNGVVNEHTHREEVQGCARLTDPRAPAIGRKLGGCAEADLTRGTVFAHDPRKGRNHFLMREAQARIYRQQ